MPRHKPVSISSTGAWTLGKGTHYFFDTGLAGGLLNIVERNETVVDLGAVPDITCNTCDSFGIAAEGFDGVRDISERTRGVVQYRDLTVPFLPCPKYDWVFSLEVAEHIPRMHETAYLSNINCSARKGLVLSWAQPGQAGHGHVNARRRRELHALLGNYHFVMQPNATRALREQSNTTWFRWNLIVFARGKYVPPPSGPPAPLRRTNYERECYVASWDGERGVKARQRACRWPTDACAPLACANLSHTTDNFYDVEEARLVKKRTCKQRGSEVHVDSVTELMPRWRTREQPISPADGSCMGAILADGCDPMMRHSQLRENATSSAFCSVALVLLTRDVRHVPLLLGYARWFASVTFVFSEPATACESCGALARNKSLPVVECACVSEDAGSTASAMANAAHQLYARGVASADKCVTAGVVYMHGEFALHPRQFEEGATPLDDFWTPRGGLHAVRYHDPCCSSGSMTRLNKDKCAAVAGALGAKECCMAWTDFVYVPRHALSEFARLLQLPQLRGVLSEVAIPSVINHLVRKGGDRSTSWRLLPRCQGSKTAARLEMRQLWATHAGHCGHKWEFGRPYYDRWMGHLLRGGEGRCR